MGISLGDMRTVGREAPHAYTHSGLPTYLYISQGNSNYAPLSMPTVYVHVHFSSAPLHHDGGNDRSNQ